MALILFLVIPIAIYFTSVLILDEMTKQAGVSVLDICSSKNSWANSMLTDINLVNACKEVQLIEYLQFAGVSLAAFSVVTFGLVFLSAKIAGDNRDLNALIFPKLVPLMIFFIGASVLTQGVAATFALYELQVQFVGSWYPIITIGFGIGSIGVAFSIISSSLNIQKKIELSQRGIVIDDKNSPIWDFVNKIAEEVKVKVPDNIVIGLEPNFYATTADVVALSSNKTVTGETLYISAPLMRLFKKDELKAVIGHELGHFKADDVRYAEKFSPVYRSLTNAISSALKQKSILSVPAILSLDFIKSAFQFNEKKISRQREYEADKIGSQASSSQALINALVKLNIFSGNWSSLQHQLVQNLNLGRAINNLSTLYIASVAYDTDDSQTKALLEKSLSSKTSHPIDTHPTLLERIKSLDLTSECVFNTQLSIPEESISELIIEIDEIEQQLTIDEQKFYLQLGVATWEIDKPEGDEPYNLAELIETAAALMVCADGKIELSEIRRAEELGMSMIRHFNPLIFREKCFNESSLPYKDEIITIFNKIDDSNFIDVVKEFLTAIAESDGVIDETEQKFIDDIIKRG